MNPKYLECNYFYESSHVFKVIFCHVIVLNFCILGQEWTSFFSQIFDFLAIHFI